MSQTKAVFTDFPFTVDVFCFGRFEVPTAAQRRVSSRPVVGHCTCCHFHTVPLSPLTLLLLDSIFCN